MISAMMQLLTSSYIVLQKDMFPSLSQSLCFSGSACPNLGKKPISSQFQVLLLRDNVCP